MTPLKLCHSCYVPRRSGDDKDTANAADGVADADAASDAAPSADTTSAANATPSPKAAKTVDNTTQVPSPAKATRAARADANIWNPNPCLILVHTRMYWYIQVYTELHDATI